MKVTVTYLEEKEVEVDDKYKVLLDDDFDNWFPVQEEMVTEICNKLNIDDRCSVEAVETEEGYIYL